MKEIFKLHMHINNDIYCEYLLGSCHWGDSKKYPLQHNLFIALLLGSKAETL